MLSNTEYFQETTTEVSKISTRTHEDKYDILILLLGVVAKEPQRGDTPA